MKLFLSFTVLASIINIGFSQQDVVDVALSMPETFSRLVALVTKAGLVVALKDPALDSTVFAPTNDAFDALDSLNLPSANSMTLLTDSDWTPHLQNFLLYHVLGGSQVPAEAVTDGLTATMLNGEDVNFSVTNEGGVNVNTASVAIADVSASNGIIHVVDEVLAPSWVSNSVVDRVVNEGDLTSLVTLVTLAELVETLDSPGKFTVFAPNDDAFNALLTLINVGVDYFEDNIPFLSEVLTYHVIPGVYSESDLVTGLTIPTVQGERLSFGISEEGVPTVNDIEIVESDILANNGIVHKIGGVLAPSTPFPPTSSNTIVDIAVGLPDSFSTLVTLVTQADLAGFLSQPFPYTVFAPVDAAFGSLDPDLVAALVTTPYKMHLRSILSYHVLEGAVFASEIESGMMPQTLNGNTISLNVNGEGEVFVNENSQVVSANVEADNGVIHVIDNVLLPPWTSMSVLDVAKMRPELSTLVDLLGVVGLDQRLASRPGPFTLLAPTNRGFLDLLVRINRGVEDLLQLEDTFNAVTNLLEYHILDGIYTSEMITDGTVLKTSFGYETTFEVTDYEIYNNGARFIQTDIVANNGIIHILDLVSMH